MHPDRHLQSCGQFAVARVSNSISPALLEGGIMKGGAFYAKIVQVAKAKLGPAQDIKLEQNAAIDRSDQCEP